MARKSLMNFLKYFGVRFRVKVLFDIIKIINKEKQNVFLQN